MNHREKLDSLRRGIRAYAIVGIASCMASILATNDFIDFMGAGCAVVCFILILQSSSDMIEHI